MKLAAVAVVAWLVLAAGCAAPSSPLLRNVVEIRPDGKNVVLPDNKLSSFVRMLRARLPVPTQNPWGHRADAPTAILAVEKNVLDGTGEEGF